ncbi:MAG: hypothetical protein D3917_06595, partial [Candidatus Electrothrix sp. AX5]|nr:hypothetical protein [Candidatus Electrothrix sp. AX5]
MLKLKSFLCYLVLLSLAFPLGNAWAKKPRFNKDSVSAITLDVVRMEACASGKGCVTASGPMQLDLLELADGKVDFANQVLLPEKTQYLQLMFGENSTITVDDELFPLSVPGGTKSGLKLKGRKAFGKEGGFLTSLELQFKLGKKIVAQRNKIRSKDKGQRRQVSYVYSYKLKPVIKVATAEVEALPENIAAVVALPNEEVTLTLGDDFSMRIPAGAVSEATIITAEELKYFVEVKDEATGEIVRKPGLASTYELGPEGTQFDKPLKVAIGYHTDTLPSRISENDLAVFHDGKRVLSDIETASQVAVADISHFSTVTVSYGVCEETVVEDGIIYRNCGDKTGYPDMHVVLADRVKLRNSYKLKVLAKNEWNGRFTTQTVEQLANTNNAIVAINASYFSLTPEDYSVEVPGAFTTQTTIMNNIVMQDREYGNEVAIAFGDDGKDSSIPIRRISKEELIMRSYDMEAGNLPEGDCSYITEKVRKGYNIDSGKSYVEDINECYRERKEWSGKCFNIIDSYMSTVSGMTSMTLEQQLERHNEFVTDFVDCESGKWARNVASLIDFISPPLDFSEVAQFKSSNILSSTVGVRFTVLERNEGAKESTCKYQGDSLDEPASAIGYSDKDIIFVSSDMFLFADRQFDTWNSLCEVFRVQGGEAEAVQLDSGCSPQLVVNGELKNGYCRWEDGEERHVLNAIGLVPINREIPEPSQAIVDSVSPSTATLNERTLFTVTGLRLSSDLRFSLDGCENVDQILANSTTMVFLCTPRAVGNRSGTIEDFFYNRIFDFTVTVFDEPSTLPVVTSVSPGEAVLDEQTIFTVTGQNLPSTLAFFVEECANLQSLGGTSTSMLFRCIPSWTTGLKDGVVKDESGGTTLYSFQVNVSDETPVTSPIVNSVTPTEAVLNQPTTFTVSG